MQTICRLIQLTPSDANALVGEPSTLPERIAAATSYSDVYRYWGGIQFLLDRHSPDEPAARWLELGRRVAPIDPSLPDDRVISVADVAALDQVLRRVSEEDLAPHYDAAVMDAANIYPVSWQSWEEDFDPLGQVLEHYWFLREFVAKCAKTGAVLLLHFEFLEEGSV
jgi:hypothetical protein